MNFAIVACIFYGVDLRKKSRHGPWRMSRMHGCSQRASVSPLLLSVGVDCSLDCVDVGCEFFLCGNPVFDCVAGVDYGGMCPVNFMPDCRQWHFADFLGQISGRSELLNILLLDGGGHPLASCSGSEHFWRTFFWRGG